MVSRQPGTHRALKPGCRFDLPSGALGHAGDGNLHPTILTDRRNTAEWRRVHVAVEVIFEADPRSRGTLSGEVRSKQ